MVITRFAPSPTGSMHIGNARTAIFNYLIAQQHKGNMRLRIEDTDQIRSTEHAKQIIFETLDFLGIKYDGDIVYQSNNKHEHQQIALHLLEQGKAYRCYHTQEELDALKTQGQAFRSQYRDTTKTLDKPFVVRFKVPNTGTITVDDEVRGAIEVAYNTIEDFALLRSDGSPTYLLAVVCDDHKMHVNWIIRGADHLTNTFKQLQIIQAMNWIAPRYSHIPLITDATGKKLSKRDGDVSVLDFEKQGILPQALFNYLMRLGWGHKEAENTPIDQLATLFSEQGFGKSSAKFDLTKLLNLSGQYMNILDNSTLLNYAKNFSQKHMPLTQYTKQQPNWARFEQGLDFIKGRSKTLIELLNMGKTFLFDQVDQYDQPYEHIYLLEQWIKNADFAHNLDIQFRTYCTEQNLDFKQAASWLRYKITGQKVSPPIFDTLYILGKDLSLSRLLS